MFPDGLATQYHFIFHLYKTQRRRCVGCSHQNHVVDGFATFNMWLVLRLLEVLAFGLPGLVRTNTRHCWRRSSRGHAHWLTHELDPGIEGSPPAVLGMYCSAHLSHGGIIFKDAAFREQCVVENIWAAYMTEPS